MDVYVKASEIKASYLLIALLRHRLLFLVCARFTGPVLQPQVLPESSFCRWVIRSPGLETSCGGRARLEPVTVPVVPRG